MKRLLLVFALLLLLSASAVAADPEFTLVIKDHRFEPAELTVPAGQKVKLIVENQRRHARRVRKQSPQARKGHCRQVVGDDLHRAAQRRAATPSSANTTKRPRKGVIVAK